jgi:AraC-like DNA-binding protein
VSFKVYADLVGLIKGIVSSLQPYATSQEVHLNFKEDLKVQYSYYHPNDFIPQFSAFLIRIVSFTPQQHKIDVSLGKQTDEEGYCLLSVINSGVNLDHITEILNELKFKTTAENLNNQGTLFLVEIPIQPTRENLENASSSSYASPHVAPYYLKVSQRLKSFFGTIGELEASAMLTGYSEGVFLKKVNAVISSRMPDNKFNVDELASSVALSRTQLFRKVKQLTKMSPGRYILFYRLQKAKQLLQSKQENLNVSEVCYQVGFISKSHFTRSFQKQHGFPPSKCK